MTDLTKLSDEDLIFKHRSICFGYMAEKISERELLEVEQEIKYRLARLREYEADYEAVKERCYNRGFVEGVKMERERTENARPEQDE